MPCSKSLIAAAACSLVCLSAATASAKPYKGAEVYQLEPFLYGKVAMRMKLARGSGILSTFFLYKDGSEGVGEFWEEIDIEGMGKDDSRTWQSNIITGLKKTMSQEVHDAGVALADGYHTYVGAHSSTYV